ncbi:maspardin-like [Watersipora subatra]|uniref:maspardin-like n=1 Tax=Watersipora subatra TaxID=2589382 RepID=UPI00355B626F
MDMQNTPEYISLRSSVPQRKVVVDGNIEWSYYDAGPRSIQNPIVFLPPASGTADVFFRQLLSLSSFGCRAISVNHPVVWSVQAWCLSFNAFLNSLEVDRVHLFGANLGGFLAQKFAEYSGNGRRVRSMVLCNGFNDTDVFQQTTSSLSFWALPAVMLKKMVMGNFDSQAMDRQMYAAVEFMNAKMDSLSQQELASRLTLNCVSCYVEPQNVQVDSSDVTLMNVFDDQALSNAVQNEMGKLYPEARRAYLKTGGNFPYLSRSDEVNCYIQVHLQRYADTVYSAFEPRQFAESAQPSTSASKPPPSGDNSEELIESSSELKESEDSFETFLEQPLETNSEQRVKPEPEVTFQEAAVDSHNIDSAAANESFS